VQLTKLKPLIQMQTQWRRISWYDMGTSSIRK